MFSAALSAFVGCFAAMIALAEVQIANKLLKYLVALVCGVIITFLLALVLAWVARIFGQV